MTTNGSAPAPIVVGIDGSAEARHAARWAAAEAMRRSTAVELAHITGTRELVTLPATLRPARSIGEAWLDEAVSEARAVWPGVPVSIKVRGGESVEGALIEASGHALMLVIGTRGFGRPLATLADSPAVTIARNARCPVVTIPLPTRLQPAHPDGPVVVGIDGSAVSDAATAFAFEEAALRHCALVAVHTWSDVAIEDNHTVARRPGSWETIRHEQKLLLADRLATWQDRYPHVRVMPVVAQDRPVRNLLEQAIDAQLLVVGSRGRGGYEGMLLGSTSQALLYNSPCPLAVVRQRTT